MPKVKDLEALNVLLRESCAKDDLRRPEGHTRLVIEEWADEAPLLARLPSTPFDTAEVTTCGVDSKSRVKVRTNRYSVPVRLSGRQVEVRVLARTVVIVHEGRVVAEHERLYDQHGERLVLDHYLELLMGKPGAMPGARPLRQARDRDEWPASYDRLWGRLRERHGETAGTREMIDVLLLHRTHPASDVNMAVEMALTLGCCDAGAMAVLVRGLRFPDVPRTPLDVLGELAAIGTPAVEADMDPYDDLLRRFGGAA